MPANFEKIMSSSLKERLLKNAANAQAEMESPVLPAEFILKEHPPEEELQLQYNLMRSHIRELLAYMGENPEREGLLDTPDRILKSWKELYAGYSRDPAEILSKIFSETDGYDQIVLLRNIPFYSACEHHALIYAGCAHIGYLPKAKVVGISKLARLLDCFARRMQIQERMTMQIAQSIMKYLDPLGCAVVVIGTHYCMTARGVNKSGATMVTAAMEGVFKYNEGGIKDEFYQLIKI